MADDRPAGPAAAEPSGGTDETVPTAADLAPAEEPSPADPHPAVFIDSSAIVALVDGDDASHPAAVEAYRGLVDAGYKLFTTNYVINEAFDLLSAGVGPAVARQWLRETTLAVYHADEQDERRARRLVGRAEGNRGLSLTDAVSLVAMERLEVADAFAVDPSFLAETS